MLELLRAHDTIVEEFKMRLRIYEEKIVSLENDRNHFLHEKRKFEEMYNELKNSLEAKKK